MNSIDLLKSLSLFHKLLEYKTFTLTAAKRPEELNSISESSSRPFLKNLKRLEPEPESLLKSMKELSVWLINKLWELSVLMIFSKSSESYLRLLKFKKLSKRLLKRLLKFHKLLQSKRLLKKLLKFQDIKKLKRSFMFQSKLLKLLKILFRNSSKFHLWLKKLSKFQELLKKSLTE